MSNKVKPMGPKSILVWKNRCYRHIAERYKPISLSSYGSIGLAQMDSRYLNWHCAMSFTPKSAGAGKNGKYAMILNSKLAFATVF